MHRRPRLLAPATWAALLVAGCSTQQPAESSASAQGSPPSGTARDVHALRTSWDGMVIGADGSTASDQLERTVHIALTDDPARRVKLVLAPGWYLDRTGLRLEPSHRVRVTGKPAHSHDGHPVVVVWAVEQGTIKLRLRDEQGRPVWPETEPAAQPPRDPSQGRGKSPAPSPH